MSNEDLKKDLENFLKKQLDPINRRNIEQEKARHERFLEKHAEKSEKLSEKHSSSITQLITLEGVILTAIVIFANPQEATIWLTLGICSILFSLFFGIWLQNIATQADYQSQEWDYEQEMKHYWWSRELWKDETVKTEKEVVEPHLKEREDAYKKTFTYKVLKFFHLNHDRVENIFKTLFLISLLFLILHFVSLQFEGVRFGLDVAKP
ncbi:MAG: hypothetical protein A3C30_00240 [Candidatus Levybacteria bacterium RIFCSPHIGHO2_02_FULL_40_18]|nr:MAG: hypothetical protein A2869_03935 [Candidatus Levybacteria bacterium RIFCSPHIGHO2_01_FULL_40_58]OGH27132.1 MAG: hypothetical protein A3C30_00240 [Candidatus Levybacteria bacterium RIFCSPHIGHO2_02_FULL_40_18]OGH30991.1 MAG: hypothetical protein A3E43_04655 [Candidatus Levybacteria bacterium RIFCSPHIGHO2_12_FULL_40_31]OGH41002.1 MAG: hypothetical protein A2894_01870 [Candidatus Levybacteria bacterium RIFCSPLOWO2_01_FULL_40_64]OGH48921.1 MAG: hypothetical protein A3I54_02685 [Candidatus Lev